MLRKKLKIRGAIIKNSDLRFWTQVSCLKSHALCLMLCIFFTLVSVFMVTAEESSKVVSKNIFIIKSIEIEGSRTMPPETILGILQTRAGEEVSVKLIRDDVKELFKLGQFSNIEVDSSGSESGIDLKFILEEYPKVEAVSLSGNEEIKDGKIKDVLTIGPGRSLSGKLLHENESKILSLYQKKGYYLAEVDHKVVEDSEGSASVLFKISEGKKIEVQEIEIIGNRRISDREIRKQMKIKKGKRFDDSYFEGDLSSVEEYYHQNGFINARITNSGKDFNEDKSGLIVRIELEEGPQFRVGSINAVVQPYKESNPLFLEEEILDEFTLKEGDIFSEIAFRESLAGINKMYGDKGHVSVQIKDERDYNSEEEIVNLKLKIYEGGPAYIESVPINWVSETSDDPHKTKEYVIRRELDRFDVRSGEMFSYQNIADARRKILTLGPFIRGASPRLVPLGAETAAGDDKQVVAVNFDIEESRQSGMFSIAGGYGSGDGDDGSLFGALDIWDDNILGRAWRLHIRGEIGTKDRRTGQIFFSTPWVFDSPVSLGFSLYSRRRNTRYVPGELDSETLFRDESVGGSITVGRPLTRQIDLSIGLRNENTSTKERMGDDTWEEIYKGKIRSTKFILDRDTRQFITSLFDPSNGSYNTVSAEFSGLGGYKFQKYMAESSIFIPTWWKLVLVFHLRAGHLAGEDIDKMRYERFFLGGIDSIRGYDTWSITPSGDRLTSDGVYVPRYYDQFGGNKMGLLNVEYRFPITDMLRGLVFFDVGQVWAENEWPWRYFKLRRSIGVGLRIDLLGALARLEYGFPLDPAREGEKVKGGRFQFEIGPAF
jgi:outer membrane protein insertion porin family